MSNILGIDLGGTKIAMAKYHLPDGQRRDKITFQPTGQNFPAVLQQLIALIEGQRDSATVAVGIGVPGPTLKGTISRFPHIAGAENVNLQQVLEEKTSIKIVIENDANCFTVGAWQKMFSQKKEVLGLTLGTGVGGAVIGNGKLMRGQNGAAGEFGHMVIRDGKSVEELISGKALQQRWETQFGEQKSGPDIIALATHQDRRAIDFLHQVGADTGLCLANLILAFNPQVILIGGSAAAALPYYRSSIQEALRNHCFPQTIDIPIEQVLDPDCATFGAAWLAR